MGPWATTNSRRPPAPEPCTPQSVPSATIYCSTRCYTDTESRRRSRKKRGGSQEKAAVVQHGSCVPRRAVRACQHFSGGTHRLPALLRRDPAQPPSRSHLGGLQKTRPISRGSPRLALQSQQPALPGGEKPPALPQVWKPRSAPAMPSQGPEEPSGWQPSKRLRSLSSTRGHAVCT